MVFVGAGHQVAQVPTQGTRPVDGKATLPSNANREADQPTPQGLGLAFFTGLYTENRSAICQMLAALGVPSADLDDAVQEVFVVALRKRDELGSDSHRLWLRAVARNVARNRRRGVRRWLTMLESLVQFSRPTKDQSTDDALTLVAMFKVLSPKQRDALYLYEVEGMTADEVAEILRVSPSAVHERVRSARACLKRHFPDHTLPPQRPSHE